MRDMNMLVVGASGYIGRKLFERLSVAYPTLGTSVQGHEGYSRLDLRAGDFDYSLVSESTTVFILSAISSPDDCRNKKEYARAINVLGTIRFIKRVLDNGAKVIFFSSDTVYGDSIDEFSEDKTSNPAGDYAEMKCEVENEFNDEEKFKSIRLSYVFSRDDKFTKYLIECAQKGDDVQVFHPFYRSIIHRDDVVAAAVALAERWSEYPYKIINFGGPETISRVELVLALKKINLLKELRYTIVQPDEEFFKSRPKFITMRSPIISKLLGREALSLEQFVQTELSQNNL